MIAKDKAKGKDSGRLIMAANYFSGLVDSRVCVSIAEPSVKECLQALKGIKFAEIRMDKMNAEELTNNGIKRIFSRPAVLMATCRPGSLGEELRKKMLIGAVENGAALVDVELEASDAFKKEVISKAREFGCKVIVSFHDFNKTPAKEMLEKTAIKCFESGADIAKIACASSSDEDNARLLGLLDSKRKIAVIGMGKAGKITRIMAPLLGSEFTFASLRKGKETAKGQLSIKKLGKILKELGKTMREQ
ncbi:MAG: type I 3-dehydroquinate dehydratase [Candidatus Diapherotrites archaeon]|nr:type I 3-dehydroquinate dehydratase [Candidatus Diapherotrites archaeon]